MTKVIASRGRRDSSIQTVPRLKRKPRKVKIPLKPKDIEHLYKHMEAGRESRVIRVMLATGMHPSVMANPEKYEMEIVRNQLTWHRPKTWALCVWEYHNDWDMLLKQFLHSDLGFHRSTYYKDVKNASKRAGMKHVSPLTLRHTAIIELLKVKPVETVKQITQCSDETLWNYYAKIRNLDRMGEEAKERG